VVLRDGPGARRPVPPITWVLDGASGAALHGFRAPARYPVTRVDNAFGSLLARSVDGGLEHPRPGLAWFLPHWKEPLLPIPVPSASGLGLPGPQGPDCNLRWGSYDFLLHEPDGQIHVVDGFTFEREWLASEPGRVPIGIVPDLDNDGRGEPVLSGQHPEAPTHTEIRFSRGCSRIVLNEPFTTIATLRGPGRQLRFALGASSTALALLTSEGESLARIDYDNGYWEGEASHLEATDDLDGDGWQDLLVTAHQQPLGSHSGWVRIHSGFDLSLLRQLDADAPPDWLGPDSSRRGFRGGFDACEFDDLDGDGRRDIAVYWPARQQVWLVSSADFEPLWNMPLATLDPGRSEHLGTTEELRTAPQIRLLMESPESPTSAADWMSPAPDLLQRNPAAAVAAPGDLDGDGLADLVVAHRVHAWVGSPGSERDRLWALSGADGRLLWAAGSGAGFVHGIVGLGDVDGDGRSDLLVAARTHRSMGPQLRFLCGRSGRELWTLSAAPRLDRADRIAVERLDWNDRIAAPTIWVREEYRDLPIDLQRGQELWMSGEDRTMTVTRHGLDSGAIVLRGPAGAPFWFGRGESDTQGPRFWCLQDDGRLAYELPRFDPGREGSAELLAPLDDRDGDGFEEVLIGGVSDPTRPNAGLILRSGRTGRLLLERTARQLMDPQAAPTFLAWTRWQDEPAPLGGVEAVAIGDLDGDGLSEVGCVLIGGAQIQVLQGADLERRWTVRLEDLP
jgi:hypothetical protein